MGTIINWKGYDWDQWDYCVYNNDTYSNVYFGHAASVHPDGTLHLRIDYNPKYFDGVSEYPIENPDPEMPVELREYCCARLNGPGFSYGTFKWVAKMPIGTDLWPALWFYSTESWPPEIDTVEGYSKKDSVYMKYETNVHYRDENGEHRWTGAKKLCNLLYSLFHHKDGFDEWKTVWTPKVIKIYWNGFLIRRIRSKKVLSDFNKDHSIKPIMNMMVNSGSFNDYDYSWHGELVVKDFTYKPL